MAQLWVFYDDYYQCESVNMSSFQSITIGSTENDTLTVNNMALGKSKITIRECGEKGDQSPFDVYLDGHKVGDMNVNELFETSINEHKLLIVITEDAKFEAKFFTDYEKFISLSTVDETAEIHIQDQISKNNLPFQRDNECRLVKNNEGWILLPIGNSIFVNGQRVEKEQLLKLGDIICVSFMTVTMLEDDMIHVSSFKDVCSKLPRTEQPTSEMKKKYPHYRRTPRMIYDLPKENIDLSFPTQEVEENNRGLWITILPPLVMLLVIGIVALIRPRGIFIIISIFMFATTLITSTTYYFREKRNFKKRKEKRRKVYTQYLESKRTELHDIAAKQREVLYYHFPSFERLKYMTHNISDRIWERALDSHDFLQLRLGIGSVPASYKLNLNSGDMANREIDDLFEQMQVLEKYYSEIHDVPVTIDLSQGAIGMIGHRSVVKKELHQLIGQLCFFHSYHDLRFVFIFNEKDYDEWEWMKWLPHFQLPNSHAKGLIYNEQTRDQLLSSIHEGLKERDLDSEKAKKRFAPHLVFIVANQELISEHPIMEYLENDHQHLSYSSIFAADGKESLTEHIHTLVHYINEQQGEILIQNHRATQHLFQLDAYERSNNETFARTLKTLNHQIGMTHSIPTSVSFLEMYEAEDVEALNIEMNWLSSDSTKSLAVPIGLKSKGDVVELNLHEKAHGPHGLLAGTTGSGKSEFLQTYILSLAVRFHPYQVAFLLIDYKGGGMAQPFKNIPHLLGTITNIEGSKNFSERALASIRSELKRRQTLFDQYEVNHINDYHQKFNQNLASEPLPHLFLISDEFAELKSEEPEFIKELVSAARIGRSLGVHLILATQKPGGVIDNQIWSNSRFRIALKVQDASDSKEILQNADAASITVTGRGYLQVGNNEVYELFQSAWSGAPYIKDNSEAEDEVAIVTDLGLIPLSEVTPPKKSYADNQSEIDVIVQEIIAVEQALNIKKLQSPWLPPLSTRMTIEDYVIEGDYEESVSNKKYMLGLIDEPEKQSQRPYVYQLYEDGNIGIFGSSGYGKSFTVMSFLLQMAKNMSPQQLHYYVFDFGNGALLPLKQLPHVADYFRIDEDRKLQKFVRIIKEEMNRRKDLFQQEEVSTIKMYNSMHSEPLPVIYITIDNYDSAKEEYEEIEQQLTQVVRDGQSLGIYMIFTATRINTVRQSLMNNLKTKIVHYLFDKTEGQQVTGRVSIELEAIPGRAIIKKEDSYHAQIFLPAAGEDDMEVYENIKQQVEHIREQFAEAEESNHPLPIPMLPSSLTSLEMSQYASHDDHTPRKVAIGLDEEFVEPVYIDFEKNKHCLVIGPAQKGKTNTLKLILNHFLQQDVSRIGVFDSNDRQLASYADERLIDYFESKEHISQWLEEIELELLEREEQYAQAVYQGNNESQLFPPIIMCIDNFMKFQQFVDASIQESIAKIMKNSSHLGFHFVVTGNSQDLTKGYDALTPEVKQIGQAIIVCKKGDQSVFSFSYDRKEADIHVGFGYYVDNGKATKIQIPLSVMEKEILV